MKLLNLLFLLLISSCSLLKRDEPAVRSKTWSEKKRDCHRYYLSQFGLKTDKAIGICREELERKD